MIIPVDQEKVMNEFKTKYVEKYFEEEYPKIQEKINKNKKILNEAIISKFQEVCSRAINMQEQALKSEIKYIYISYLRTSLMQNSGIYRIDLYDDKWFLDKEECSVNIDLSVIYEPLFEHMQELQETKKQYGRTITEMDIEKIKVKEADKYHEIGIDILQGLASDLVNCDEYKEMKKSEEISIFAGEYRDEAEIIYTSKHA